MVSSYSARWINTGVPISVLSFADCVRVPWASFSTRSSPSDTSAPRTPRLYSAQAAPVSQSLVILALGALTWMPEVVSDSVCSHRTQRLTNVLFFIPCPYFLSCFSSHLPGSSARLCFSLSLCFSLFRWWIQVLICVTWFRYGRIPL